MKIGRLGPVVAMAVVVISGVMATPALAEENSAGSSGRCGSIISSSNQNFPLPVDIVEAFFGWQNPLYRLMKGIPFGMGQSLSFGTDLMEGGLGNYLLLSTLAGAGKSEVLSEDSLREQDIQCPSGFPCGPDNELALRCLLPIRTGDAVDCSCLVCPDFSCCQFTAQRYFYYTPDGPKTRSNTFWDMNCACSGGDCDGILPCGVHRKRYMKAVQYTRYVCACGVAFTHDWYPKKWFFNESTCATCCKSAGMGGICNDGTICTDTESCSECDLDPDEFDHIIVDNVGLCQPETTCTCL